MNEIIKIENLTKIYKNGQGIRNISLSVKKGEVFGYLGPNGAGKSTTIRHILGFEKGHEGSITINNFNAWTQSSDVNSILGYIPGEIAMPEFMTGLEFIKYIYKLRKLTNWEEVKELIEYWEFDPNRKIKRMSKGMKQKVGLVCAFMHNPEILILDEPTSGLDPLMQDKFINKIIEFKKSGKTIILSSHIFQEVEKTCDRVAMIKNGEIIANFDMDKIIYKDEKIFDIQFENKTDMNKFKFKNGEIVSTNEKWHSVKVRINVKDINEFINYTSKFKMKFFKEIPYTLEEHFMHFYSNEDEGTKND